MTFPKHRVIEKPFRPPNPVSHLISSVSGHQLFKGSSLAKSTEGIQWLTFLCSSNHGSHQHWSQIKKAITKHSQQPVGCSSDQHMVMLWFQGGYLIVQASEISSRVWGVKGKCSSINSSGLGKKGLPGGLNVVFSPLTEFLWVSGKLFMPCLRQDYRKAWTGMGAFGSCLSGLLLGFPGSCEQGSPYMGIENILPE